MQPIVTLCLTDDGFVIHRVDPQGKMRVFRGYTDAEAAEYNGILAVSLLRAYCESLAEIKDYYEPS